MNPVNINKNLLALQGICPGVIHDTPRVFPIENIKGIPLWMRENIHILEISTKGVEGGIYFVIPKPRMAFEHLMRTYQILQEKLGPLVLVIADQMPTKHRPLLVKFRIPFIYKNESVFAPSLGVKIGNLKRFKSNSKTELIHKKEEITPFAFKILTGIFTNQIPQEFTQKNLLEILQSKTKISASKLSPTLIELTERELLNAHGAGPTKIYTQVNHQDLFEKLLSLPVTPLFKEVETNYLPKPLGEYIVAGEAALASYSNLAYPKKNIIAVSKSEFRQAFQRVSKKSIVQDSQIVTLVQVWKEDPALFAIKGLQNPIEVFITLQKNTDERVQLSLDELLKEFGLYREKA